jgi:hypothetical protein
VKAYINQLSRKKKMMDRRFDFLYALLLLLCMGLLIASPTECQFSGITLSPPNAAIGYGGLYNPLVFTPGLTARSAAFLPFLSPFGAFGLGTLGFGNTFGSLSQFGTGAFNPLFGFSNYGLGVGNSLGALSGLNSSVFNPLSLGNLSTLTLGLGFGLGNPSVPIPGATGLLSSIAPLGAVSPIRTSAQSGTWTGTWQSTYIAFPILWNTGPMSLNIVEDPLLGVVAGTAILQDSRYASIPFEVSGVLINDTITLEGFLGTGYDCVLTCILTSPTTITGFYTVLGTAIPVMDEGIFNLTLIPPVLF